MVLTGFTSFSNLLLFPLLIIFSSAIIVLIGMVFVIDALRDAPLEDIFKPSASAAASQFCEWVQVGIDVYIPYSSPWFSATSAAAIIHKNHFFCFYHQNKTKSKVLFRQASNCCKMVLEAA